MKRTLTFLFSTAPLFLFSQNNLKALVGGTLIDGYGSTPIQNSVILIEDEKIVAVRHQGNLEVPAGAEVMGVDDDYGTIEPGKFADIIAAKGDVLRYISLLQDVDLVVKHGRQVK